MSLQWTLLQWACLRWMTNYLCKKAGYVTKTVNVGLVALCQSHLEVRILPWPQTNNQDEQYSKTSKGPGAGQAPDTNQAPDVLDSCTCRGLSIVMGYNGAPVFR